MLRQFLRLGLDQVDGGSDAKDGGLDLTSLEFAEKGRPSMKNGPVDDDDPDRLVSGLGEPVRRNQPMQLRLPTPAQRDALREGVYPSPSSPPDTFGRRAEPKENRGLFAQSKKLRPKAVSDDGTGRGGRPGRLRPKLLSDDGSGRAGGDGGGGGGGGGSLQGPGGGGGGGASRGPGGYWVVRNLGRTREKRGGACVGEMDTTSVVAFREPPTLGQAPPARGARRAREVSALGGGEGNGGAGAADLIKYNEPVVLFTNYGVGGRFLAPVTSGLAAPGVGGGGGGGSGRRRLAWQLTDEDLLAAQRARRQRRARRTKVRAFETKGEGGGGGGSGSRPISFEEGGSSDDDDDEEPSHSINLANLFQLPADKLARWYVRKAGVWPPKPWEDKRAYLDREEVVKCGDLVLLESCYLPGWYAKSKRCLTMLERGPDGAEIQVLAPTLAFAQTLKARTAQYAEAARRQQGHGGGGGGGGGGGAGRGGFNLRHLAGGAAPLFPRELLRHALAFFAGSEEASLSCYSRVRELDAAARQRRGRGGGASYFKKREGLGALRAARLVCCAWREAGNTLVLSVRTGDMSELGSRAQRRGLLAFVAGCPNLTRLSLRNLDPLRAEDLRAAQLGRRLPALRTLNLGGCYRISDDIAAVIEPLSIVELNLAMTQITDDGLEQIVRCQPYLCELNLYGCEHVTEAGLIELVSELPLLSQLNLRGTGVTGQDAARLRALCKSECDILTGQALTTSLFNATSRSRFK